MNTSAFFARLIAHGIDQKYEPRCKYPRFDVCEDLEEDIPNKTVRGCKVMVAAQYILIAGSGIYEEYIAKQVRGSEKEQRGLDQWRLWADKFKEVAETGGLKPDVQTAALKAREVIVSLHPELFLNGEGRQQVTRNEARIPLCARSRGFLIGILFPFPFTSTLAQHIVTRPLFGKSAAES